MKSIFISSLFILLVCFTTNAKEVSITKQGGKKVGDGHVYYNYTYFHDTDDKTTVICRGKGPNDCFGYAAVNNSSGCNEPDPAFELPVCNIEQIVIGKIDQGYSQTKGIYSGNIYWSYKEGSFDTEEETYSYSLTISDQPLW